MKIEDFRELLENETKKLIKQIETTKKKTSAVKTAERASSKLALEEVVNKLEQLTNKLNKLEEDNKLVHEEVKKQDGTSSKLSQLEAANFELLARINELVTIKDNDNDKNIKLSKYEKVIGGLKSANSRLRKKNKFDNNKYEEFIKDEPPT